MTQPEELPKQSPRPGAEANLPAVAYVQDPASEKALRQCFDDLGMQKARVQHGSILTAIESLPEGPVPDILVVDVSGIDDPVMRLNDLAEVCNPKTEVIVIGERNDIVLYRDLKAGGVAEYFFKPLVSDILVRSIKNLIAGYATPHSARTGKLIMVLGVRGGVGATTITVSLAWHLAEELERRVLLLDLDLQGGDAVLQLDSAPSHAVREAIDHPDRVDDLFLERGVTKVTPRLGLLASLEPFNELVIPDEEAVLKLISTLRQRYRYVFVDVPPAVALKLDTLLHLPSTMLLVTDGTLASARDVARWQEKIGPNTPDRSTLVIHNKKGAEGALPEEEFLRAVGQRPELSIPYDRQIARASLFGASALHECGSIQRALSAFSRRITGEVVEHKTSLWKKVFG